VPPRVVMMVVIEHVETFKEAHSGSRS